MTIPGLSLESMLKQVRAAVVSVTSGKQIPWESSSLIGEFSFVPRLAESHPTPPPPPPLGLQGNLQANMNVDAAHVRINGVDAGLACREEPLLLRNLEAGTLTVRVKADGYDPLERPVTIAVN